MGSGPYLQSNVRSSIIRQAPAQAPLGISAAGWPDARQSCDQLKSERARYYLPLPAPRNSDANTLRTSDCEIPNCLAMREGLIPALKVARTAFTWPCVNATSGSSGCRRSDDISVAIDGFDARSPAPIWVAGRISGALVVSLPRRCSSCRVAASSLSSSRSSNCWSALERSLGSTCRGDDLSSVLTTAADCWADVWCAGVRQGSCAPATQNRSAVGC